jgi:hypothetical protein
MSRSFRRTPIFAVTTAPSDKAFKAAEHRRERRAVKIAVRLEREVPAGRLYGDPRHGDKDGKLFQPERRGAGDAEVRGAPDLSHDGGRRTP